MFLKQLYQPEHSELIISRPSAKRDIKSLKKKVCSHLCPRPGYCEDLSSKASFACVPVCQRDTGSQEIIQTWGNDPLSKFHDALCRAILGPMQEVPCLPMGNWEIEIWGFSHSLCGLGKSQSFSTSIYPCPWRTQCLLISCCFFNYGRTQQASAEIRGFSEPLARRQKEMCKNQLMFVQQWVPCLQCTIWCQVLQSLV